MEKILIDRKKAATMGREVVQICAQGFYLAPSGQRIEIAADLKRAIAGTVEYRPDEHVSRKASGGKATRFSVSNETTLSAAQKLAQTGARVAALNFASAKNPGGGFLNGARAQEESLCRSSALYDCLKDREMYPYHRARHDGLYSPWVIYSPDVPVFRDDHGALLEAPYNVSFLTSPAVNFGVVMREKSRRHEITSSMRERIERVLGVAVLHGHDTLVLGAWGCGVFRNDPGEIASLFHAALHGPFFGAFETVVFAVVDGWQDRHTIGPFENLFSNQTSG